MTKLTEKFEQALIYASKLHGNQTRKLDNIPYISHLLSVSALILEAGGSEDEAISGLLHDAIEDQGGKATREEIRQKFGKTIVEIVDGCTESDIVFYRNNRLIFSPFQWNASLRAGNSIPRRVYVIHDCGRFGFLR